MEYAEIISTVRDNQASCGHRFHVTHSDGTKVVARLFVSSAGNLCRFKKNSRCRGLIIAPGEYFHVVPVIKKVRSDEERFVINCDKVIRILTESGMWPDLLEKALYLRKIGYAQALKYLESPQKDVPAEFSSSMFNKVRDCEIRKMYFGKSENAERLEQIRFAIESGTSLEFKLEANKSEGLFYDTSFRYEPEGHRGCYSLEYSGCANGHYWLAISPTHAIFYEDD